MHLLQVYVYSVRVVGLWLDELWFAASSFDGYSSLVPPTSSLS